MKIIDKQGCLFGKINIIDFAVFLILFISIPAFIFGHKVLTREVPSPPPELTYTIKRNCPICGKTKEIVIPRGESLPLHYKAKCSRCGNEVVYINNCSKLKFDSKYYTICATCPNCGYKIPREIELGKGAPEKYEIICPSCKNKVIIEPELNWSEEYYKRELSR